MGELGGLRELDTSLVIVAEMLVVKGLGDDADELVGDVVGEEITEVHDRSVILAREPRFLLSLAVTADVATVATGDLLAGAIVLPKTVFKESLGKSYFNKASVGTDVERLGRVEQPPGVDDTEESNLLFPYLQHRVVEGENELFSFLLLLIIAILLGHSGGL